MVHVCHCVFLYLRTFLSRMVKNMTDRELKVFLLLMLGIHVVEVAGEILGLDVKPWAVCAVYRMGLLFSPGIWP